MENDTCTVHVSGLSAFNLTAFSSSQDPEQEKSGYDSVAPTVTCFNEVVATQDADITRTVQLPVEGVPYEASTIVTSVCQDNLLTGTHVAVLSVPENSIFEVVQAQAVPQQVSVQTVGEVSVTDGIATHVCGEKGPCTGHNEHNHELEQQGHLAEPKKRKGGWPKGKKRKKEFSDLNKPKAPVTGYVRFLNIRRESLKQQHPHLTFPEITKLLGLEWNSLLSEEKQKFLDEAEDDKKRYVEELKAYQQSEQYQAFVKRQAAKRTKHNAGVDGTEDDLETRSSSLLLQQQEEADNNDLFCKTCNQYFSSLHNKREHMYGRQHLQMLTCEFEREAEQAAVTPITFNTSQVNSTQIIPASTALTVGQHGVLGIPQFTESFMEQNLNRELEIRELRKSVLVSQDQNHLLVKQIEELKAVLQKVESDMSSAKAFGASLTAQLNSLRMVPTLFGVQLHLNFTG